MQRWFRAMLAAAAIGGLIGGCATYRPDPLDPAAVLEDLRARDVDRFVVERARPGDVGQGVTLGAAFDESDGLDEAEVVAVALALNPDLRARRAEVGEAQAALITAGLWPNPQASIGIRPGIGGAAGTDLEGNVLFELLRPGERDARKQAAAAGADETREEVVAAEVRLVGEVRQQRLSVLAADRAVEFLKETAALRQRGFDLVRQQREIGETTLLALSAAELELAEARRDLRQAEVTLAAERQALNGLLGLPPDYELKLTGLGAPLVITVVEDVTDEELDRRLLAGRPELLAKQAGYRRAEQELRLAVLQQYPDLAVGPAFERELEGDMSLGLAFSIELPIFDQNQGVIAQRRVARDRTRAEFVALLHRLRGEAHAARAGVRAARGELDAQERDILPLLRRNQELFEGAYRAREIGIMEWLVAQQRSVAARREYLDALVRYRRALIRLETAVGRPLASAPGSATTLPSTTPDGTQ